MRRLISYGLGLIFCFSGNLLAQHVLYGDVYQNRSGIRLQVIGKSENYYWVEKLQRQKSKIRNISQYATDLQSFGLLDQKLNLLMEFPAIHFSGTLKQWLICGSEGMDQFFMTRTPNKTTFSVSHFPIREFQSDHAPVALDSLPFPADPSDVLLVRSEDHSKILLAAFESVSDEMTKVHVILFDSRWKTIYHKIFSDIQFVKPCIQDEEIGFAGENFDDLPIKLTNNGEWLMAAPSRLSHNFSIFHAGPDGSQFHFREIPISPFYHMEDIAMSVNNERQEMSVGILSAYSKTTLKNVQVINYSMNPGIAGFDTSFHFNTQYSEIRNKYLRHERFYAIPGNGFLYLVEYGNPNEENNSDILSFTAEEAAFLVPYPMEIKNLTAVPENGYSLHTGLTPSPVIKNKGDLHIFYFPAISKDSTWNGNLAMEQHPDVNLPDLSYLLVPDGKTMYMIYNQYDQWRDALAAATALKTNGESSIKPIVFWQTDKKMDFQSAHRFSDSEVSVPYTENNQRGFAIIKLK